MWVLLRFKGGEGVGPQVVTKKTAKQYDDSVWEVVGEFDTMEAALAMRKLLSSV